MMTHSNRMPEDLLDFQSLEISKNRSGKHLSELTGTVDSACREKNRVDDLLRSLPVLFVFDSVIGSSLVFLPQCGYL